ncbi:MAG: HPr family phosphocarrier protein [Acidobacteriota bacterium]|nr:HPr family phosphocarrier protein [Acidobacteriota bacterium]
MVESEVKIVNRLGLHARAAAKLVHLASGFGADIRILSSGEDVDAKSMLGVLLLAATQGTQVLIRCEGRDENEALTALVGLIANRFGEGK